MHVCVRVGCLVVSIDVSPQDKVQDVVQKSLAAARNDGDASGADAALSEVREEWCVVCNDQGELDRWATLEQCGVTKGTTLRLKQQLRVQPHSAQKLSLLAKLRSQGKISVGAPECSAHTSASSAGSHSQDSEDDCPSSLPTPLHASYRMPCVLSPCSFSPRPVTLLKERRETLGKLELGKLERVAPYRRTDSNNSNLSAANSKCSSPAFAPSLPIKVRTSTGKILKLQVAAADSMNAVMQKVRQKWTLASGEQCLAKIKDTSALQLLRQGLTVEQCGVALGSLLVLTQSTAACPPYEAASTDGLADLQSPRVCPPEVAKGIRVRLPDSRVVRLRNMSYSKSLVSDIVEAVKMKLGGGCNDDAIVSKQLTRLEGDSTLAQCGVGSGEVVLYSPGEQSVDALAAAPRDGEPLPPFAHPPPRHSFLPPAGPSALSHLPPSLQASEQLLRSASSSVAPSPLCQFTLCSLSPIFGPILPPTLSLPQC